MPFWLSLTFVGKARSISQSEEPEKWERGESQRYSTQVSFSLTRKHQTRQEKRSNTLTAGSTVCKKARVFVSGKPHHSSIMFAS
jgi:hypothetical protein